MTVATSVLLEYLTAGPHAASASTLRTVTASLPDDCVKALNLLHDWLNTLLPHCLSKVRGFGWSARGTSCSRKA